MSDFNINEDAQSGGESSQNDQPTTSQPSESAFPDEDEDTITMLDVIERESKLEEEASAVLGNSDEKNCTYPKGYIPRQALYSCATCADGPDKMAAICLACSLECHDNHEVYELYTKRNYRCDCGNSKFKPEFECKLMDKRSKKSPLNEDNKYNHNFKGRYCICDKKYPPDETDDSAESNDEMWQCVVCEDWYHTKHLGAKELPAKFEEMICRNCVDKLDFVHHYKNLEKLVDAQVPIPQAPSNCKEEKKEPEAKEEEVPTSATTTESISDKEPDVEENGNAKVETSVSTITVNSAPTVCESDTNDSQVENKDPVVLKTATPNPLPVSDCVLEKLISYHKSEMSTGEDSKASNSNNDLKGPMFWMDCSWRAKLCKCTKCLELYKLKECEFLLDDRDTVQYYEAQGKEITKDRETPYERGMSALNRMNRAAVVEALHGYDELKADLSDYLRKFADSKKVVRESDIHEFFSQLRSKKRPRLEYE